MRMRVVNETLDRGISPQLRATSDNHNLWRQGEENGRCNL